MTTNEILPVDELVRRDGRLDLTHGELYTLAAFVLCIQHTRPSPSYLEIGIWGGGTIKVLKAQAPKVRYVGLDLFEDFAVDATTNTHLSGNFTMAAIQEFLGPEVQLVKGDSAQVMPQMQDQFDFIFIDGNHTYEACLEDFHNAAKLLKPGGFIGFHNASGYHQPDFNYVHGYNGGPWRVVIDLKNAPEWTFVEQVDRLAVFTRSRRGPIF